MSEEPSVTRKNFMALTTIGIGGVLAAGMFIPGLAYIIGQVLKEQETGEWIRVGPTSKVEIGTPTLFSAEIERQTGWITNNESLTVYVYTENGRDYIAMSNICTHLGCRVRWIDDTQEFFCPCHNGVFDKQGLVVSGPPPRPLDRYEVKIEADQIFIKAG